MTMFKQTTEWKLFKTEIEIVTRLPSNKYNARASTKSVCECMSVEMYAECRVHRE